MFVLAEPCHAWLIGFHRRPVVVSGCLLFVRYGDEQTTEDRGIISVQENYGDMLCTFRSLERD